MIFGKKSFAKVFLAAIMACGAFWITAASSFAASLPVPGSGNFDSIIGDNRIVNLYEAAGGGATSAENTLEFIFRDEVALVINIVVGAVALIWISILATKFISSQGEEEKITNYKKQFGFIILGLLLVSVAEFAAFNLANPVNNIVDPDRGTQNVFIDDLYSRIDILVTFFQFIVGGAILIVGGMSAYNMVTSGHKEEKQQSEKTFFKAFILGTVTILLSEIIVRVVALETRTGLEISPMEGVNVGIVEITGIINFILTFIAIAAFILFMFGVFSFIISFGREEQASKAKKMIIYSIVTIILAIISYTLTSYIVSNYYL